MPLLVTNTDIDAGLSADEILASRWDRCLANTAAKTALGTAAGIAVSFLFFRRAVWPIAGLAGVGIGIASEQCSREFNPYLGINDRVKTV